VRLEHLSDAQKRAYILADICSVASSLGFI
jgi:hypothetical protein